MKDSKEAFFTQIKEYAKRDLMVAFSGGADSSLLLAAACEQAKLTGKKVYAATIHTTLHPMEELEAAKRTAAEIGAIHIVFSTDELMEAGIFQNPRDRCYRCKKHLFTLLIDKAAEYGITTILEGTNEDDLHVYRPGIKALRELGIKSPLAEAGMTKADVRTLAEEYKITAAKRPSAPCLATRFPYGTTLSYEAMRRVELGESYMKKRGFYNVRLRVHGDVLRIEVDTASIIALVEQKEGITDFLKGLGYSYITLDLEGFRSGSMDENLNKEKEMKCINLDKTADNNL